MKKLGITATAILLVLAAVVAFAQMSGKGKASSGKPGWTFDAKIIEACSCRLFCPCYFNMSPEQHFCQFNNAINVVSGNYGGVNLAGVKVWVSGDLGENFEQNTQRWAVFTFDPSVTQAQIDAMSKILGTIYDLKFDVLGVDKKPISWEIAGDKAVAKLGNGADGTVELSAFKDKSGKIAVIRNLAYWGAKSNTGFNLYKSKHHYKGHDHEYKFEDTNGFVIEITSSGDVAAN